MCARVSDFELNTAGWIDIQINGLAGVNFGNPDITLAQFRSVCEKLWADGVTHFLPTLITDSMDRMEAALARLAAFRQESDVGPSILGFHLEGPFLSPVDGPRGAHPLEHCRLPSISDFEKLQTSAAGSIRLVTLAPELDGAVQLIRHLTSKGICTAIGHTAAERNHILAAVDAGTTLATHLGNASHEMLHRHRNYVYDQLGEDRLFASLIVDGHHLPPHVVKSFVRAKGIGRTILISDAVQLAGMPPGIYDAGYRKFEIRSDGYIGVYGEPRMAGSGLMLRTGIENVMRFADVSLEQASEMVTINPASFLNLQQLPDASVAFSFHPPSGIITVNETRIGNRVVYRKGVTTP